jgi:hypothetical protein
VGAPTLESEFNVGVVTTIPKGTPVVRANNIDEDGFWSEEWIGMDEIAKSWYRNYGFYINAEDVDIEA